MHDLEIEMSIVPFRAQGFAGPSWRGPSGNERRALGYVARRWPARYGWHPQAQLGGGSFDGSLVARPSWPCSSVARESCPRIAGRMPATHKGARALATENHRQAALDDATHRLANRTYVIARSAAKLAPAQAGEAISIPGTRDCFAPLAMTYRPVPPNDFAFAPHDKGCCEDARGVVAYSGLMNGSTACCAGAQLDLGDVGD
jgi:hypothetical protein